MTCLEAVQYHMVKNRNKVLKAFTGTTWDMKNEVIFVIDRLFLPLFELHSCCSYLNISSPCYPMANLSNGNSAT